MVIVTKKNTQKTKYICIEQREPHNKPFNNNETNFQIEQIVLLISLSIALTLYIILELPLFDCIIIINSVVAVALYEERIYIG